MDTDANIEPNICKCTSQLLNNKRTTLVATSQNFFHVLFLQKLLRKRFSSECDFSTWKCLSESFKPRTYGGRSWGFEHIFKQYYRIRARCYQSDSSTNLKIPRWTQQAVFVIMNNFTNHRQASKEPFRLQIFQAKKFHFLLRTWKEWRPRFSTSQKCLFSMPNTS